VLLAGWAGDVSFWAKFAGACVVGLPGAVGIGASSGSLSVSESTLPSAG
jgi:hypothetical protein